MTTYEKWSICLTIIYDFLTFGLLVFVIYESIVKPKRPNIVCDIIRIPRDTKSQINASRLCDLYIENRGVELKNISITSSPDKLNWQQYNVDEKQVTTVSKTSEQFPVPIPYLATNQILQYFWCNTSDNSEIFEEPFTIHIEFDNPGFFRCGKRKRIKKSFLFDYTAVKGVISGVNKKYDIHNVAQENSRIREELRKITDYLKNLEKSKT